MLVIILSRAILRIGTDLGITQATQVLGECLMVILLQILKMPQTLERMMEVP